MWHACSASMRDEKDGTSCYCDGRTVLSRYLDDACPERQAAHVCSSASSYLQRPARQLFARELCARERSRQAHSLHTYFAAHIGLLTTPGDLSVAPKVTGIMSGEPSTITGELDATVMLDCGSKKHQNKDARVAHVSQGTRCRDGKCHPGHLEVSKGFVSTHRHSRLHAA
jgi:hypothetical protein